RHVDVGIRGVFFLVQRGDRVGDPRAIRADARIAHRLQLEDVGRLERTPALRRYRTIDDHRVRGQDENRHTCEGSTRHSDLLAPTAVESAPAVYFSSPVSAAAAFRPRVVFRAGFLPLFSLAARGARVLVTPSAR